MFSLSNYYTLLDCTGCDSSNLSVWLTRARDATTILTFAIAAFTYVSNQDNSTRNKRKEALEKLKVWIKREESESRAIELLASLNYEQTLSFWKGKEIELLKTNKSSDKKLKDRQQNLKYAYLKNLNILKDNYNPIINSSEKSPEELLLTSKEVIEIRRHAFDYLNNLEIILLSWRDDIVDRNLIFEQFSPLVSNSKLFPVTLFQDDFSEEIDKACNSDDNCPKPPKNVCPAITNFYNYCENKIKLANKKIDDCNSRLELQWYLKEVMANRQISPISLSQKTQLSLHNLLSLENNLPHPINPQELEKLCIALKCQPGDLIKLVPKLDSNT